MLRTVLRLLVLLLIVSSVIFAACIDFFNELNKDGVVFNEFLLVFLHNNNLIKNSFYSVGGFMLL